MASKRLQWQIYDEEGEIVDFYRNIPFQISKVTEAMDVSKGNIKNVESFCECSDQGCVPKTDDMSQTYIAPELRGPCWLRYDRLRGTDSASFLSSSPQFDSSMLRSHSESESNSSNRSKTLPYAIIDVTSKRSVHFGSKLAISPW